MKTIYILIASIVLQATNFCEAQTQEESTFPKSSIEKIPNTETVELLLKRYGLEWHAKSTDGKTCANENPSLRRGPFSEIGGNPNDTFISFRGEPDSQSGINKKAELKNLIWVHGLNGNQGSLHLPAHATQYGSSGFPARKARCYGIYGDPKTQLYNEDNGLTVAAGNLDTYCKLNIRFDKTENDYIIAHSQGGMVSREWLRMMDQQPHLYGKFAYGLVTFGSPHGGAMILNNCRPNLGNKAVGFLNEACRQLGGTLVADIARSSFLTRLIMSDNMKNNIIDKSCNVLSQGIIPLALDNYYKRTTLDYYVGSPFLEGGSGYIQGLSNYELKVPIVQFVGIEQQPILWKLVSSLADMGHDKLDNREIHFGYSADNQMELKVNGMMNEFHLKAEQENQKAIHNHKMEISSYLSAAVSLALGKIGLAATSLAAASAYALLKNRAIENKRLYEGGKSWLSVANDIYLTDIVGARVTETTKYCRVVDYLQCTSPQYNTPGSGKPPIDVIVTRNFKSINGSCYVTPIPQEYSSYHFRGPDGVNYVGPCTGRRETIETFVTTSYYKPNDGVVLAESAGQKIKVASGNIHRIVPMYGSNHEQMKNDSNLKQALLNLYNGDHGAFFEIEKY